MSLKIDFAEATLHHNDNGPDDYFVGKVVTSVTVGPGDRNEVPLEKGDYVYLITAMGDTRGKVTINIK